MAEDLNSHLLEETERVCGMLHAAETAIEQLADELTVYGAGVRAPLVSGAELRQRLRELAVAADHCHTYAEQAVQALDDTGSKRCED